ncbi:hypothetical protein BH20ACI4_BH20ACI4_23720 [soil metagenome]
MIKSQRAIIPIFCILFAVFAFSQTVFAQILPPDYGFLEVVDYKNEPVADASVRSLSGHTYKELKSVQGRLLEKTNQKGLLEKGIRLDYNNREMPFAIDKEGFYTFIDYFGLFGFLGDGRRNNRSEPIKIELLKIPANRAEKKITGNEQQKREFFGAARSGDSVAVRQFIKSGLSPNLTTSDLRGVPTPKDIPIIIFAAKAGSSAAVKEFISAGANVRTKTESIPDVLAVYLGAYPYRFNYSPTEAEKSEMLDAFESGAEGLIDAGADINSGVLSLAAGKGYLRTVKKLITKGASINTPDGAGRTALLTAVDHGQIEIVGFLLENGANPNLLYGDSENYDNYCASPLMTAVFREDFNLIKLLLAKTADPNLTCKNGQNALRVAIKNNKFEIFEMLIKAGADARAVDDNGETNLMFAARNGNAAAVGKMLERGVPVNARNKQGSTALMFAVIGYGTMKSRFEKVKLLLEAGADPNIINEQKFGGSSGSQFERCETALINVAGDADADADENAPLSIIDLLIAHKADVNFTCQNGWNALHRAIYNGQVKGVRKLLDAGADVSGEKGKAALDYARKVPKYDFKKSRVEEIMRILEAAVVK